MLFSKYRDIGRNCSATRWKSEASETGRHQELSPNPGAPSESRGLGRDNNDELHLDCYQIVWDSVYGESKQTQGSSRVLAIAAWARHQVSMPWTFVEHTDEIVRLILFTMQLLTKGLTGICPFAAFEGRVQEFHMNQHCSIKEKTWVVCMCSGWLGIIKTSELFQLLEVKKMWDPQIDPFQHTVWTCFSVVPILE